MATARLSTFRIIGGRWRGRKVNYAPSPKLRASGDRLRETLFNCLGQRLDGRRCLDLFAGAGSLGMEAASRGATEVVCIDKHPSTAQAIRQAARRLGARQVAVYAMAAQDFLLKNQILFDVAFIDPPFDDYAQDELWHELLAAVYCHVAADAIVYCESDRYITPPSFWRIQRRQRAGNVCWQLLSR